MVEKVREDLLQALRARTASKGLSDSQIEKFPVRGVAEDAVPFVGSPIAGRRVFPRDTADRLFRIQK